MTDRPPVSGEPSTEAGRRLARLLDDGSGTLFAPDILAIEAEARATPPPLLVDERPCSVECCDAQERRHIHEGARR